VKDAAKRAAERGVKVYTVGIGTAEGELIPLDKGGFVKDRKGQVVKSRLDETTLQDVATETGGAAVLHRTSVLYPEAALRQKVAGTVTVEVTLDGSGNVAVCGVNRRCYWLSHKRCGRFSCERRT
jgi:hypothetical protein